RAPASYSGRGGRAADIEAALVAEVGGDRGAAPGAARQVLAEGDVAERGGDRRLGRGEGRRGAAVEDGQGPGQGRPVGQAEAVAGDVDWAVEGPRAGPAGRDPDGGLARPGVAVRVGPAAGGSGPEAAQGVEAEGDVVGGSRPVDRGQPAGDVV